MVGPATDGRSSRLANAPCSYGAWEETIGLEGAYVAEAAKILDLMADAGYGGVDLGPVGYFGDAESLRTDLQLRGLALAGAFVALPFSSPAELAPAMAKLDGVLDLLDKVAPGQAIAPKPTLADAGSEQRRRHPAMTVSDPGKGWTSAEWRTAAAGIQEAAERCRERGYDPTFHPHVATNVEAMWEIDRVLEMTDVGLCFDSGHLAIACGDPVDCLARWGDRVNHVHIKDIDRAVVDSVLQGGGHSWDLWTKKAFRPLGQGDLDLPAVAGRLRASSYLGWILVEQDLLTWSAAEFAVASRDQVANREFLSALGL